jgi:hypothetical protein
MASLPDAWRFVSIAFAPRFRALGSAESCNVLSQLSQKRCSLSTKRWPLSIITIAEKCRSAEFCDNACDLACRIHRAETVLAAWCATGSLRQAALQS